MEALPRRQSRVKTRPTSALPDKIRRFKCLMQSVFLTEGQTRTLAGAAGVPIELPNGGHWLKPNEISQSYFSRMMSGQVPTPDWRMGQMVAICEYVAAIRLLQVRSGHPDTKLLGGLLKTTPTFLGWFLKQPEIFLWIKRFRYALFNRAKLDRDKSADDEAIYQTYNEYLKKIDGQMDAEITSENMGEAADDATMQTPA